uniref:IST1 homolog n=1 Tax=Ciona intestinalis TaxID=7719 RepID=UPI000180C244|nr:IST1 homolog [Ciona intestinalis]|eukprot:XP_009861510.1 IST1 homolog [Ciona intestinalis]
MFGPRFNEQKLKVNLNLVVTRLKLMEKKKTDLAMRARPEIAEYVKIAKTDRARVRVEHIIREDYLVEAMELVEMYADLLIGRVPLMKQSKALDDSLKTPISTLIWAAPRLTQYCQELKIVRDLLGAYYGKKYVEACLSNQVGTVCDKVMAKLDPSPPKKSLVENYLVEICKVADVPFTPDARVMAEDIAKIEGVDTDFMDFNSDFPGAPPSNFGGSSGGCGGGQIATPQFSYQAATASTPIGGAYGGPAAAVYNDPAATFTTPQPPTYSATDPYRAPDNYLPPDEKQAPPLPGKGPVGSPEKSDLSKDPSGVSPHLPPYNGSQGPVPAPRSTTPNFPNLPSVPTNIPGNSLPSAPVDNNDDDDVNFDDLSRRFENLRKKT